MRSLLAATTVTVIWIAIALTRKTRNWSDRQWSGAVITILALAFAGQALSMTIFYNGGQGDDRYQLAFVEVASHGRIFDDYFYGGVRGHYPPLIFWIGGLIQALGNLDSVTTLRWLPLPAIIATTLLVVWSSIRSRSSPSLSLIISFGMGSFLVSYLTNFGPTRGMWALLILKPQQVLGGAMTAAFAVAIADRRKIASRTRILICSLLSAGIILTMPLYLVMAVGGGGMALLRGHTFSDQRFRSRATGELLASLVVGLVLTAFYWLPMALAVLGGNWQNNYLYWQSIETLDPSRWTVGFAFGVPIVAGILAIRRYSDSATWALTGVTVASGVIYASAYLTYPLFGVSFLSWWAPIPAGISLSILAARYLRDWLELRFEAGPIDISFRRARWPAIMLISAAILPLANWNTFTDSQLERAHDSFNTDLIEGARILREQLGPGQTFVAGSDSLLLSGMSGRPLTFVAHSFYSNPMARADERRAVVEALLRDPNCQRSGEIAASWNMAAIVAEIIPVAGGASVNSETAQVEHSESLGISILDPARGFSPTKAGTTTYLPLSPKIDSEPCWTRVHSGTTLAIFLYTEVHAQPTVA